MSDELRTMQMVVTKASYDKETDERRIRMVASDTSEDYFEEAMSVELFNNFVKRIAEPVPETWMKVLREKGWQGGMPYTSISHYPSGKNGANIPADIKSVYVDGEMLKSVAVARKTPLGNKLWEALKADLDGTSSYEEKIRVSIGFVDLKHSHGDFVFTRDTLESRCAMCENGVGNKVYLDGILVHEAFTRVPANRNTSAEVEKMAEINTRQEDAESIVGELTNDLEVNKSVVSDVLVIKDENGNETEVEVQVEVDTVSTEAEQIVSEVEDEPVVEDKKVEVPAIFDEPKSALDLALESFKSKVVEMKSLSRDEALAKLQNEFETLAEVVRGEFPAPTVEEKTNDILKSLLDKVDELVQSNKSLTEEVAILKAQKSVVASKPDAEPVRRSIVSRSPVPTIPEKPKSIAEIARASVGIVD